MLNKTQRIPKKQIPAIARKGKRFVSELFDVKVWYDNAIEASKFAVIVSKKVHKSAVIRNTIKRKFKAAIFELEKEQFFRRGSYMVLVKAATVADLKSQELKAIVQEVVC